MEKEAELARAIAGKEQAEAEAAAEMVDLKSRLAANLALLSEAVDRVMAGA